MMGFILLAVVVSAIYVGLVLVGWVITSHPTSHYDRMREKWMRARQDQEDQ